jgi:hypothetical protein
MRHTPGPWGEVSDEFGKCKRSIAYPDGDDRDHDLCVVQCGDPDELEANARLIAAAPEMLAVLQDMVVTFARADTPAARGMLVAARSAIARAEGKS